MRLIGFIILVLVSTPFLAEAHGLHYDGVACNIADHEVIDPVEIRIMHFFDVHPSFVNKINIEHEDFKIEGTATFFEAHHSIVLLEWNQNQIIFDSEKDYLVDGARYVVGKWIFPSVAGAPGVEHKVVCKVSGVTRP